MCIPYISTELQNKLNEYNGLSIDPQQQVNFQHIQSIIVDLNKYYDEKNWGQVAVNIRKLSDFTKTLYNTNNGPLSTILQSNKWIQLYALGDAKNLQRIDQKLEAFPTFEEIDSSREFANSELHISSNTKQLVIDLQMLPSQPAINFLVNIAIEGANFQETRDENTFNVKWESIFDPVQITNSGREELEKPVLHISQDKRPLDKFHEQNTISNDIAQYLFNNNKIQYIDNNTDTFKLLNSFWNYNWVMMRKMVKSKLSQPNLNIKKNNPLMYYQLKLSEAWIYFQLGEAKQAINIWEEIEKECPKDYPHIRKLILNNLRGLAFTEYHDSEMDTTRYKESQQYKDITIVNDNIRFNKSNIIETINKEFDFKNGKTITLGQETRQFFLYNAYLPHLTKSICVVLEKGMFFMLPELLEDLIDLSIMQYQYYGVGNQRYFFMLHNLARNIYGFNSACLERYFSIIPLWDLQNHIEEIQPLINNILSSNKLKSIDLKFLKIIAPILNSEQQLKITQCAKSFFENPEVAYGDNYFAHAVWGEYLKIYFTILELNQSLWEKEQEWIITKLCMIDVIIHNNPLPFIERLIHNTKFPISDELLDTLCELIKNQKDYMGNPISEYELISRISNIYAFHNKKLPEEYQNIFRKYQSMWLYNNRNTMSQITAEDINLAFKYIEHIINEYYKYDQKSLPTNRYYEIPRYISLYVSFIEEHKDIIDYEQSYKDIEKLWTNFLDFCKNSDSIPFQLLLEIQSYLIYFSSENKFAKYPNIDCYINLENWKDKVHTYFTNGGNKQEYEPSMIFLGAILQYIYNSKKSSIDEFHYLLNIMPWHRYHYCKQGIVTWKELIPEDIKKILQIKILDMISISQTELIGEDIINVYKILFENTDKMNSLQQFKDVCSFPIYYEIDKKTI